MRALSVLSLLALCGCPGLDLDRGRAYPCLPDSGAGQDYYFYSASDPSCPPHWRCGLEGYCHKRDAGLDYLCVSDLNCELGWRCSSEGRCVDSSLDGFSDGGAATTFTVKRLNPLWLTDRPELIAQMESVPTVFDEFGNATAYPTRSISFIADGGLIQIVAQPDDAGNWQAFPVQREKLPYHRYLALAEAPGAAIALADDGTSDVVVYDGGSFTLAWPGFPATQLRTGAGTDIPFFLNAGPFPTGNPFLLAWGGNHYELATQQTTDCVSDGTGGWNAVSGQPPEVVAPVPTGGCIPAPDGGCEVIRDMAVLTPANSSFFFFYDTSFVAATDDGLFIALRSPKCPNTSDFVFDDGTPGAPAPHWQALDTSDIPNAACSGPAPSGPAYQVRRLHGLSEQIPDTWMLAEEVPVGSDPKLNTNVSLSLLLFGQGSGVNCSSLTPVVDAVTCAACPAPTQFVGAQLSTFSAPIDPTNPDGGNQLFPVAEVRCALIGPDGGAAGVEVSQLDFSRVFFNDPVGACVPQYVSQGAAGSAASLALEDRATSGNPSFAGSYGQVWLEQGLLANASRLTLDRVPSAVLSVAGQVVVVAGDAGTWVSDDNLGFSLSAVDYGSTLASVGQRPEWQVQADGTVRDTRFRQGGRYLVVGNLDPTADAFRAPVNATLLSLPGNQWQLVVASFDSLLGADVTQVVQVLAGLTPGEVGAAVLPATVTLRAVPLAKSPILSLASTQLEPGQNGLFGGYVLTTNGVARFTAITPEHWESEVVAVPAGDWVGVASENGRGRLGYVDGTVISLPSRVPLSGPFTDGTVMSDYASICGQTIGLGSTGLYHLVPPASGLGAGTWTPLDLSAAIIRGNADTGLLGGKVFAPGGELDVFGRVGTASRITCP